MTRFTLYDYVAHHNPEEANQLLKKYGYAPERKIKNIAENLMQIASKFKEKALDEIAEIHPDKMLLNKSVVAQNEMAYQNACGCESCKEKNKLNADAATSTITNNPIAQTQNTKDIVLILIGAALIIYAIKA